MKHGPFTRWFHLAVAAAIVFQLASSLVMGVPRPGRHLGEIAATSFALHRGVGIVSAALIALFWLIVLWRRAGTPLGMFYPWFSRARLAALRKAIGIYLAGARELRMPHPEHGEPLATAVQGIGLLAAALMAATGTALFFLWTPGTPIVGTVRTILVAHALISKVLWTYLIVHVGASLAHELSGQSVLAQMSPRGRG